MPVPGKLAKSNPAWRELWALSVELRSIAYLIGMQRSDEAPPLDIEEIHWGTGRLLERMARRARRISREMEKQDQDSV